MRAAARPCRAYLEYYDEEKLGFSRPRCLRACNCSLLRLMSFSRDPLQLKQEFIYLNFAILQHSKRTNSRFDCLMDRLYSRLLKRAYGQMHLSQILFDVQTSKSD